MHDDQGPAKLPTLLINPGGPGASGLAWPVNIAAEGVATSVLTHYDYWSGNVVWRDGTLTGIVDWSGAARGPRGYDLGWCRLDLVLLYGRRLAELLLAAYEAAVGQTLADVVLWDAWAAARSHAAVATWAPNYAPLGRGDLNEQELRQRHALWTTSLLEQT